MYYTPVTKSALQLTYCVEILGVYRLFVYGKHVCYSPSQIIIILVIIPGIVLLPMCLELALRLLKKKQINSTCFVVCIAFPFSSVLLYIWNKKYDASREEMRKLGISKDKEEKLSSYEVNSYLESNMPFIMHL